MEADMTWRYRKRNERGKASLWLVSAAALGLACCCLAYYLRQANYSESEVYTSAAEWLKDLLSGKLDAHAITSILYKTHSNSGPVKPILTTAT